MNFQRIGFIRTDLEAIKDWCRSQRATMQPTVSNYTVGGRLEKWFEKRWKLSLPVEVFDAEHNERIYQLGQRLYPGNHACLFLYYPPGAYIKPHRDHTTSEAWVVQVNLGCPVTLTVGDEQHPVEDGEVIGFNSKLLHSVSPATAERWVVSWRKIKPQYLNQQLSLFRSNGGDGAMKARLTVELVPSTCWFSNVRDHVPSKTWDLLRKHTYSRANYRCEVCGGRGSQHPVECHEIWHYDDQKKVQKLLGLTALCPSCHEVKHIGLAGVRGRRQQACKHLARVNGWTSEQVEEYLEEVWLLWSKRSQHQWKLDLSWLSEQFGIKIEEKR